MTHLKFVGKIFVVLLVLCSLPVGCGDGPDNYPRCNSATGKCAGGCGPGTKCG